MIDCHPKGVAWWFILRASIEKLSFNPIEMEWTDTEGLRGKFNWFESEFGWSRVARTIQ